jgi:hypothetical protein
MASWPDTAELARVLNFDNVDDWSDTLDRVMAAAISWAKSKRGLWDEDADEPTDNLAQAALRMAELISLRPEVAAAINENDPTISRLLVGQRKRFGIA